MLEKRFSNKTCCTNRGFHTNEKQCCEAIYRIYKLQNVVRQLYSLFSPDNRVVPNFFVEGKILVTKKLWEEDFRNKNVWKIIWGPSDRRVEISYILVVRRFTAWKSRNPWWSNWFCWRKNFGSQKNVGKKIFETKMFGKQFGGPSDWRIKISYILAVPRFTALISRNPWYYNWFRWRKHFGNHKNVGKKIFEQKMFGNKFGSQKNVWKKIFERKVLGKESGNQNILQKLDSGFFRPRHFAEARIGFFQTKTFCKS